MAFFGRPPDRLHRLEAQLDHLNRERNEQLRDYTGWRERTTAMQRSTAERITEVKEDMRVGIAEIKTLVQQGHQGTSDTLRRIETQTTATNGRVSALESKIAALEAADQTEIRYDVKVEQAEDRGERRAEGVRRHTDDARTYSLARVIGWATVAAAGATAIATAAAAWMHL